MMDGDCLDSDRHRQGRVGEQRRGGLIEGESEERATEDEKQEAFLTN
jgi:hypothetical protein